MSISKLYKIYFFFKSHQSCKYVSTDSTWLLFNYQYIIYIIYLLVIYYTNPPKYLVVVTSNHRRTSMKRFLNVKVINNN